MPMSATAEGTSPIVPKQLKPWRPIDEGKHFTHYSDVANTNVYAAAYRWSSRKRERDENDGGREQRNQSYISPQKGTHCQKQSTDSSSVKESIEKDLQDLFNQDYDLKAPFEQNIRILKDRKRSKDSNALRSVSDDSPSRKKRRTPREPKTKGNEKVIVYPAHEHDQLVSHTPVTSKNKQSNMEKSHQSVDTLAYDKTRFADSPTSTATKAAEPAFDPPKAPRAHFLLKGSSSHVQIEETDSNRSHYLQHSTSNNPHGPVATRQGSDSSVTKPVSIASSAAHSNPQNTASNEGGNRSAKTPPKCECNLPDFFTAHYHRIPNLKKWSGEKEEFLRHVRNIADCKSHPFNVRRACRNMVRSHEASLTRNNEVQLFRATDLASGIFSNGNGRYEVRRGRSQSTIAPDNFYHPARNADQGKSAECLVPKNEALSSALSSPPLTTTSLSPDRASRASSTKSDYNQYEISNAGLGVIRQLTEFTSASDVDEEEGSPPNAHGKTMPNEGAADKEAQDIVDWAADLLEQELASTCGKQSPTQKSGPSEVNHNEENPESSILMSPSKPCSTFSSRAKRHQSLPARLATPAPAAVKPAQTPGDKVKAFAREHLAKVPNLSIIEIKRVVEELDRRLTDIEADKETSRSTKSSDRSENAAPSNIIHYSVRHGSRDVPSASKSQTANNPSASTSVATPASGFLPINQPVSNTRESSNAMPPPPLPHMPKSKSIAQQKLEKPELSADVPVDQRLPEEEIIQLGRRKFAYSRHEGAPYAFNYRGKLRKEYRYLLTKVGADGKTVWIAEEVARLS